MGIVGVVIVWYLVCVVLNDVYVFNVDIKFFGDDLIVGCCMFLVVGLCVD